MSQTIDFKSFKISKNPCNTKDSLKIEVEAVYKLPVQEKEQKLPFTLPISGLGKGEFVE